MALQADVRAVLLTEALRQVGRRNLDLVRSRFEQKRVRNTRHMAGHALTRFRAGLVVRVFDDAVTVRSMTGQAHLIWIFLVLERSRIALEVR